MLDKINILLCTIFFTSCCLSGCGIDSKESTYKYRIKSLNEIAEKADPDTKKIIETEKKRVEDAYAKLPTDTNARIDTLAKLNRSTYKFITDTEKKMEKIEAANKAAQDAAVKAEFDSRLALLAGNWNGLGMHLLITADGTIQYERIGNGGKTSITGGKVVSITKDSFTVKVLVAKTVFKIDNPPIQKGSIWTMKVDGVELKKND